MSQPYQVEKPLRFPHRLFSHRPRWTDFLVEAIAEPSHWTVKVYPLKPDSYRLYGHRTQGGIVIPGRPEPAVIAQMMKSWVTETVASAGLKISHFTLIGSVDPYERAVRCFLYLKP